jgi:regulator of protease activity HflC (stomatin/prohibitin superfamily)
MDKLPKLGLPIIFLVVVGIILLFKTAVTIDGGEAGVMFKRFSGGIDIEETYGEGFHVVAPWNDMIIYKVRQQSVADKMSVLSVNGLEVDVDGTVWFQPIKSKLGLLHQEKGKNYVQEILAPAISAAAISVGGRYTP